MKRRNVYRAHRAAPAKSNTSLQVQLILLTICCVAVVAAGFFFAARQHFATMEFGLKNSKLRKQVEDLEAERRRLILAKEVSLSPGEISRTAARLGFREQIVAPPTAVDPRVVTTMNRTEPAAELTSMRVTSASQPAAQKAAEVKKLVRPILQQTVAQTAAPNERPRIAESDKNVASVAAKPTSKLR